MKSLLFTTALLAAIGATVVAHAAVVAAHHSGAAVSGEIAADAYVRFGPKADICGALASGHAENLFDHLVRAGEHARRNCET